MRLRTKSFLILGLAAALAVPAAVAEDQGTVSAWQPPHVGRPGMKGRGGEELLSKLTDAQRAELRKFRAEHGEKRIRGEAERRILKMQIEEMLAATTLDEDAVRAKHAQLERLEQAASRDRLEARLALRRIVGPELAKKLHDGRRHHRRERRHGT